jgi:hypothetical protein
VPSPISTTSASAIQRHPEDRLDRRAAALGGRRADADERAHRSEDRARVAEQRLRQRPGQRCGERRLREPAHVGLQPRGDGSRSRALGSPLKQRGPAFQRPRCTALARSAGHGVEA